MIKIQADYEALGQLPLERCQAINQALDLWGELLDAILADVPFEVALIRMVAPWLRGDAHGDVGAAVVAMCSPAEDAQRRAIVHCATLLRFIEEGGVIGDGAVAFARAFGKVVDEYLQYLEAPRH